MKSIDLWIITTADGKYIAKGSPRDRRLISVDDKSNKQRIMVYGSERTAKAACTYNQGFYNMKFKRSGEWEEDKEGFETYEDYYNSQFKVVKCKLIPQ